MSAEEMFKKFAKKEGLYDVSFEKCRDFIPYFKIIFSESGCCDHQSYVEITADGRVEFDGLRCDFENLQLLTDAINQKIKELGW